MRVSSLSLVIGISLLTLGAISVSAQVSPPFTQCPPVGADTSCAILIVVTDKSVNVYSDSSQGPFDTIEDTLIGVQNNSSGTLFSLPLSSPNPIFSFDADGICGTSPITGQPYSPAPPACPYGPTTYEGPGVSFSSIGSNFTSGIVNFAGGIPPGGSAYFSLELAITTVCPTLSGQALSVPLLKQFTGYPMSWGGDTYDNYPSGDTVHIMKSLGCATTSSAMIINNFGGSTDPGALNTWLAQHNGYSPKHGVSWFSVANYATNVQHVALSYQPGTSPNDFVVDNYLCARDPVILEVTSPTGKTHFIVAIGGKSNPNGGSTYLINDPGYSCATLNQATCSYNNQYQGIRKFSPGPAPLSGLEIHAGSPIELLVTAPNGQQTGFDPVTGSIVQQIPASDYYTESIGDDSGGSADTPPVKKIEVGTPSSGQYTLQVIGTGSGDFTLWFAGYDINGASSVQTVSGTVTTGQKFGFLVGYSSAPGSPINVVPLDTTPPAITVSANPSTLWPPNGKMVPVTVSGTITDNEPGGTGINLSTPAYKVIDEYGQVQPTGSLSLDSSGNYSITILLEASRNGNDEGGRQYKITVSAVDNAGNPGSSSTVVSVPHDQGH